MTEFQRKKIYCILKLEFSVNRLLRINIISQTVFVVTGIGVN